MASRKFTFVELHMHGDAEFSPGSQYGPRRSDETETESEEEATESPEAESESGSGIGRAIGVLILLIAAARIVRMVRNRGGEEDAVERIEVGAGTTETTAG